MIIMINGAFGVGKTTVANELLTKVDNSMLFDPEEVGFMLRHIITDKIMLPHEKTGDFQDLNLWKVLTVQVAESLRKNYKKSLIVPMTIYNKDYFKYIFEGLKHIDQNTYHFCLVASENTIYERLRKRGEEEGNWCFQQTKKCIQAFQDECFAEYVLTDNVQVDTIVKGILNRVSN